MILDKDEISKHVDELATVLLQVHAKYGLDTSVEKDMMNLHTLVYCSNFSRLIIIGSIDSPLAFSMMISDEEKLSVRVVGIDYSTANNSIVFYATAIIYQTLKYFIE